MEYKTYTVETKAIDAEKGIYEALISTESVDRDGDILKAEGADLTNFNKNPVVLFGHNYRDATAVVGKALEVVKEAGQGIRARFQFADKETSPHADLVHRLWRGGFLNATSVGFIPNQHEARKDEDGNDTEYGRTYTEWELLEFSIVPVPANQEALRLAYKEMGLDVPVKTEEDTSEEIADLGEDTPPGEDPPTEPEPEAASEPITDDPSHDASDELTEDQLDTILEIAEDIQEIFNE